MPVFPDEWSLDICVAGAQKCLAGPPGMSLMSVSEDAWTAIRENPSAPRGSFLSMLDWKEQWIDGEKFPFTPSVVDLYGVEAACDEILEHGLEESFAQHELAAKATRAGVQAMGLQLWACREEITAACATAIAVPEGLDHQSGARPLPRALRRDGLGRPGRGQPRPHRAHGPDLALALPDRRALGASAARSPTSASPVSVGAGVEAALEVLSHRGGRCARDARSLRAAPAAHGRGGHRAARRARRRRRCSTAAAPSSC